MDGGQSSSNSTPPFLTKTYDMVDDRSTDAIVSWSPIGRSFVVWNPPEFAKELLPMYFKHNNFSSFVRQLNTYGFRKIDPEQWEFGNEEFVRGQRHLLRNIHRRKPIHSHSASSLVNLNHLTDSEKHEYEEEIEKLQHDKKLLMIELQRHGQEKQEFQVQIRSLGERVEGIEQRQRKLMASMAQLLQNPGFASTLMQQSEIHNKKRRLLRPQVHENSESVPASLFNFELIEKLESSLTFCENFLHGVGQESGLLKMDSIEMHASSEDPDTHPEPSTPKLNMPSPESEFSGSTNHADSPAICSIYQDIDNRPKLSIDVNSKPVTVPDYEDEQVVVVVETLNSVAPAGANDGFWEQFLTETPGSARTQEVQSERKENVVKKSDSKPPSDQGKFWWNTINNVGNLTEQMGHLSSVEKT